MLTLKEALTVNQVRDRLRGALRAGDVYAVREEVINVLAELGSGRVIAEPIDQEADTLRSTGPDTDPDSAPPVDLRRPSGGA